MDIACPSCGERERLRGERASPDVIRLECETCRHRWERDVTRRCRLCGSDDIRLTPEPLWEKGRGDQRTPAGFRDAYACNACGGQDVLSGSPIPSG